MADSREPHRQILLVLLFIFLALFSLQLFDPLFLGFSLVQFTLLQQPSTPTTASTMCHRFISVCSLSVPTTALKMLLPHTSPF